MPAGAEQRLIVQDFLVQDFLASSYYGMRRGHDAIARIASAVSASAGKKASIASSESVTSTGVPNTVIVLMNDQTCRLPLMS